MGPTDQEMTASGRVVILTDLKTKVYAMSSEPHREAARLVRGRGSRDNMDKSLYYGFLWKEWARKVSRFKMDYFE